MSFSHKDANQVLRAAFDDATGRLKTDATFTGELSVALDAANDSVAIGDGVDTMAVNEDGSINATIIGTPTLEISASSGDNIAISDGTNELEINTDGSINVEVSNFPVSQDVTLPTYATRVDEASASITYVGKAAAGTANSSAAWQISRMSVSGSVTSIEYADSNTNFDNVWDNRASLSYG
jgi:hypothetical protein